MTPIRMGEGDQERNRRYTCLDRMSHDVCHCCAGAYPEPRHQEDYLGGSRCAARSYFVNFISLPKNQTRIHILANERIPTQTT
jgi:hypothetical protein